MSVSRETLPSVLLAGFRIKQRPRSRSELHRSGVNSGDAFCASVPKYIAI